MLYLSRFRRGARLWGVSGTTQAGVSRGIMCNDLSGLCMWHSYIRHHVLKPRIRGKQFRKPSCRRGLAVFGALVYLALCHVTPVSEWWGGHDQTASVRYLGNAHQPPACSALDPPAAPRCSYPILRPQCRALRRCIVVLVNLFSACAGQDLGESGKWDCNLRHVVCSGPG